ncbi:MAG: DUF58 domain-containing protein, partial [Dehalococcoidia bacterium]|nr:DUF58 domain-containing protein [Dehalococcoidia bacterium]
MKVWLAFALLVALFLAGLITGYSYFFRLSYLLAGVLALGSAWAWLSLWGLEVTAGRRPQRLRAGTSLEENVSVRNHSPLPKVGLQVIEESPLASFAQLHVLSLGPGAEAAVRLCTPELERGCYSLGPTWVIVSDPFGIFQKRRLVRAASDLIVHPRVFHLPNLLSPRSDLSGESRSPQRLPYLTPKAVDIREYYPGDSLNRIHWPLTARWQKFMVKEFEIDPSHNVWIILDLESSVQRGKGQESTEEYGVSLVASLAQHFLDQGYSLGLVAYGRPQAVLIPDRGSRQLMRILDYLAGVSAGGEVSLVGAINRHERSLSRRDLAVLVTPSPKEDWV